MIGPEAANIGAATWLWALELRGRRPSLADMEGALQAVFRNNQAHDSLPQVLTKVCALNDLYAAGAKHAVPWARKICRREDLGQDIALADPQAVMSIGEQYYVAATKYCHFHNPAAFPIADQYAARAVDALFEDEGLPPFWVNDQVRRHYEDWRERLDQLRGGELPYTTMDRWLWLLGRLLRNGWRTLAAPPEHAPNDPVSQLLRQRWDLARQLVPAQLAEPLGQ